MKNIKLENVKLRKKPNDLLVDSLYTLYYTVLI